MCLSLLTHPLLQWPYLHIILITAHYIHRYLYDCLPLFSWQRFCTSSILCFLSLSFPYLTSYPIHCNLSSLCITQLVALQHSTAILLKPAYDSSFGLLVHHSSVILELPISLLSATLILVSNKQQLLKPHIFHRKLSLPQVCIRLLSNISFYFPSRPSLPHALFIYQMHF